MGIKEREWSDSSFGYRFGFNGQEMDDEVAGEGNSYDYGARIYDSRLGRWMSRDPLASKQPSWSPYKAFLDNPTMFVDVTGETEVIVTTTINAKTGKTTTMITTANNIMTDGEIHKVDYLVGDGWYNANFYYDFTTINIIYTDGNGKILDASTSHQINFETGVKDNDGTNVGSKNEGKSKFDWSFSEVPGGIAFYSKSGQGGETKKSSGNPMMVDIDPILAAISAVKTGSGGGAAKSLIEGLDKILSAQGLGSDIGDALGTESPLPSSQKKEQRDTVCMHCGDDPHGIGTVTKDKQGTVIDTLEESTLGK